MTPSRRTNLAFTLIELVVVLTIISITIAMAAPSLRGWSDGAKLRDATDQFLAATQLARGQAILTATEHVLSIDPATNGYLLSTRTGETTTPVASEWGRITPMPMEFRFDLVSGGENGAICFFPDSRCTPAVVRITSARGEITEIACNSPAEPFRIVGGAR